MSRSAIKSRGFSVEVTKTDLGAKLLRDKVKGAELMYGYAGYDLKVRDKDGRVIGEVGAEGYCLRPDEEDYARIGYAKIAEEHRGKGLYPEMLKALRDAVKKDGCAGIVSYSEFREGGMSDRSWEKFAEREPRVKEDRGDYYLSALPKTGRIPLATAKRALKSLGRKATACRITPAALREGMEVEREHRDVTRGGVLKTAKIAAAHLCEDGRYYQELKKLERKLKRRK